MVLALAVGPQPPSGPSASFGVGRAEAWLERARGMLESCF